MTVRRRYTKFQSVNISYSALVVKKPDSSILRGELAISGRVKHSPALDFRRLLIPLYYDIDSIVLDLIQSYERQQVSPDSAYLHKQSGQEFTNKKREFLEVVFRKIKPRVIKGLREAKKVIDKLLRIDPSDVETLFFVSNYYYNLKDYKKALDYLQSAYLFGKKANIDSRLAFNISYTLAKLYLLTGNNENASSLTREISYLAHNDRDSLIKLAKLYKSLGLTQNLNDCIKKISSLGKGIKSGQ